MQAPVRFPLINDHPEQHYFTNQQLLDYYEQSLMAAFHQVEELKKITRSRREMGWCVICSSSSSSHSLKPSSSTRRANDVFKKSHGRRSSRMTSIQKGDMKEGPSNSDGLMLAVDKFLTAEFRG